MLTEYIGLKLVNRQKTGSYQVRSIPEATNEVDSRSGSNTSPDALTALNVFNGSISDPTREQVSPDPTLDTHFIIMHSVTTNAAFLRIADILQLACTQSTGFNITAPPSTVPPSLTPTRQQLTVPHHPYVDMLPWASVRDRMLNSITAINEFEFVMDMGASDLKVWGSTPWDPLGWEVGPEFARKWWFLMDEGILCASNFWRVQRGEESLVLASLQS